MNALCMKIIGGLILCEKAAKGEVNITDEIEMIQQCLMFERIPEFWLVKSFPTMRGLSSWIMTIKQKLDFLESYKENVDQIPKLI